MKKLEIEFLKESNSIEGEKSIGALVNAKSAWDYAKFNMNKISVDYVKNIHYRLMRRLNPSIAGKIREYPCHVRNGTLYCLEPDKIEDYLGLWVEEKPRNQEGIKKLHVIFNIIHPFEDGNGRTSRILMNIHRLKTGLRLLTIKNKEREKYYDWFK